MQNAPTTSAATIAKRTGTLPALRTNSAIRAQAKFHDDGLPCPIIAPASIQKMARCTMRTDENNSRPGNGFPRNEAGNLNNLPRRQPDQLASRAN
jgi:hypothetical protein